MRQIISIGINLGTVSQIITTCLNIDIHKAKLWNFYSKTSEESKVQLSIWKEHLHSLNVRSFAVSHGCNRIDASSTGLAGYELEMPSGVVHDTWSPSEAAKSSAWREFCAVYRVLLSLEHVLGFLNACS